LLLSLAALAACYSYRFYVEAEGSTLSQKLKRTVPNNGVSCRTYRVVFVDINSQVPVIKRCTRILYMILCDGY